jgi:phosphatidate cytidylyltransferase
VRHLGSRLLIAIPGIALAVAVVWAGGVALAALLVVIAVLGLVELHSLTAAARPIRWAGDLCVVLWVVLPLFGSSPSRQLLLGAVACILVSAVGGLTARRREDVTLRVSVTVFGGLYLGLPLAMLMALREGPNGAAAVANVLVGTWAFDTFAYLGGRVWGRTPIAPRTSPNKTVEGAVIGLVGAVACVVLAGLYMDWISLVESIVLAIAICIAAFAGDLFESMLKRDAQVKDSGRILLGHGGILDRFDALLFSAPVAYLVTSWLVG